MTAPDIPRETDERDLKILRLRKAGHAPKEVAPRVDLSPSRVSQIARQIRDASIAEGEESGGWW